MKKYIIGALACLVFILVIGADVDYRESRPRTHKVFRIEASTITHSNTETAAEETTEIINGVIRQITVTVNDNTGNRTATVEIHDVDDAILWTETGIAENATTVFQYNTRSSTDLPMAIMCAGTMAISVTPSGDPGTSGMTTDVVLWGD